MSTHMTPWLYEQRALSGFIKLLVSGRHTDVDILCRGHTFNVHKTVLSAASTFFDRVCDSQFQEGQTSTITLDDDEPALVARMIIFAYSSTYHTDSLNSARPENAPFKTVPDPFAEEARADFIYDICKPRIKLHTMMYAMADKYDLTDLKSQARQRFLINFYDKDEYESHCCQDQDLQDVVIPVPETWAEVTVITKLVYSTTPSSDRGLRDIVLEFMTRYFHVSNCPSAFEAKELMHLITNTHDLAADLATRSQTKLTYECTYCGSEQGHLTWCCGCGKVDSCKEAACVEAAKKQSFCGDCCRLGTLEILEDVARFKAHKIILSAASSFFDRLSDSSFKEGHSSSVFYEPALVARMIFFAYTSQYPITSIADEPVSQFKTVHDDYPNAGASKLEGLARSRLHVRMYALADKYGLPALKAQSKQRFLISFYHHDETSPQIVGLPDNAASDDDGDDDDDETVDLHIMSLVYTTTPPSDRGLRDIVLEDACRQRQEEFDYRELLQAKGFRKLVAENHEIATDLALNTMTIGKSLVCDLCAVPGTWLAQRCKCGVIDNCTKEECLLDAKDTTFCIGCLECACLSPIKGD